MYLHIGQDYMIPADSIVTIFDMDTATWSKRTRALVARLEREGRVVPVFEDLPKSAVLVDGALGELLYLTQLSGTVLQRRAEQGAASLPGGPITHTSHKPAARIPQRKRKQNL